MRCWLALLPLHAALWGGALEIARPARSWQFMDAVGPRAAVLGREDGSFEAWVFPLKILESFELEFRLEGRTFPASSLARTIVSRAGSFAVLYAGDEFQVRESFIVPPDQPAILIRLEVRSADPLEIRARFRPQLAYMWPAGLGDPSSGWNDELRGFLFGAGGTSINALVASPDAVLTGEEYRTNYSASSRNEFSLGTVKGEAEKYVVVAASMKSRQELLNTYRSMRSGPARIQAETEAFYDRYLDSTVSLRLPDRELQDAYDWSRLSLVKALIKNPLLGEGLAAGFGMSRGGARPGFAWFFGRDSFWCSLAFTAEQDLASARAAIAFIARYQRQDGKVPHEISQSASLVRWFEDYPYAYASADATPLFAIAVRDYVQTSGDLAFARENWPRLEKALAFMRSTADPAGFPRNLEVGHGWVEGGPLLPVRTEFYQAGLFVEALRSLGHLARALGNTQSADALDQEARVKQDALHKAYWMPDRGIYAFALDPSGRQVPETSVLAAVPMWFGLTQPEASESMARHMASEDLAADWGMRIISTRSPVYNPAGYHFGSVWPLFTGWASVGEYRYHQSAPAWANLKANSWLALDGAGNTTEVLSGASYEPHSTASSHQTWSAAMVIAPLLRGLFGWEQNALEHLFRLSPHLPADWDSFSLRSRTAEFDFQRDSKQFSLHVSNRDAAPFTLEYSPALPPCASITAATWNGQPAAWERQEGGTDWHARFRLTVPPGTGRLAVQTQGVFGYVADTRPPRLAEPSRNLKILGETWTAGGKVLELAVSGRAGQEYRIPLVGGEAVSRVAGGELDPSGRFVRVAFEPAPDSPYKNETLRIELKP